LPIASLRSIYYCRSGALAAKAPFFLKGGNPNSMRVGDLRALLKQIHPQESLSDCIIACIATRNALLEKEAFAARAPLLQSVDPPYEINSRRGCRSYKTR
jgi:hypothetical protein